MQVIPIWHHGSAPVVTTTTIHAVSSLIESNRESSCPVNSAYLILFSRGNVSTLIINFNHYYNQKPSQKDPVIKETLKENITALLLRPLR